MLDRKVSARAARAEYFARSQDAIARGCSGNAWLSLAEVCESFNQLVDAPRARQMLMLLARSGQYLPRCLPCGPRHGPGDFAYATIRHVFI